MDANDSCQIISDDEDDYNNRNSGLDQYPPNVVNVENPVVTSTVTSSGSIDNLRLINEIPPRYRTVFSNYSYFNIIQSNLLDAVLYADQSVVVSAPTGSGKTVIFELAAIRFLMNSEQFTELPYKMVYVAPMKALCEERLVDWNTKFGSLSLRCISVTGDSDNIDIHSLLHHNVIITTPEKWDSLTRRWRENKKFVNMIKLFLIDEVHLLGESQRGSTLEVVVNRMKTIQDSAITNVTTPPSFRRIRFIAVSASAPNAEDIAEWLSAPTEPAKWFKFGDDMRPVILKKVVLGFPYSAQTFTPFKFDLMLSYKLQSVLLQYAEGKPTLIFCSTRKSVEMTSKYLIQNITINLSPQQKQIILTALARVTEPKIKEALANGIGFHHAGLSLEDRRTVEELFRNTSLPILVTTSTLAMGVNLPAHLVIIKYTKYYSEGEYLDYSESMLLQMIGRAGRPQYDSSATAVILTSLNDKAKFENMVSGTQPVESSLHKHLAEHLNSEVVLRTITDLGVAMQWLTSTFLHIRARKNPRYYGLPLELTAEQIDRRLLDMCQIQINKLAKAGMLIIDEDDVIITPTSTGLLMAKYYIAFETMKLFTQVSGTEILQQMLALISKCQEFSEIYLRVNDKKYLNLLNKCRNGETIRFPFNGKIKTVDMKINCLIQAVFGCLKIVDQSLLTESEKIMRIGERISRCLAEYLETKGSCYMALLSALILAKCFHARLWENSPYVSKQLTGIGPVLSSTLVTSNKTTFEAILKTNPREIERILNRKPPMGNNILNQVEQLPRYELRFEEVRRLDQFSFTLKVCLKNAEHVRGKSIVNTHSYMSLLIGNLNNDIIAYEKYTHAYMVDNKEIVKTFSFPNTSEHEIKAHFISEDLVGIDCEIHIASSTLTEDFEESRANNRKQSSIEKKAKTDSNKKQASHVQTFVDTYFKHMKTSKERCQKFRKGSSSSLLKTDGNNKENSNKTKTLLPKSTTEGKQMQSGLGNAAPNTFSVTECDLTQPSQNILQKVISSCIQDYNNSQCRTQNALTQNSCTKTTFLKAVDLNNRPAMACATSQSNQVAPEPYVLSQSQAVRNFNADAILSQASIVHSNSYSSTARRNPGIGRPLTTKLNRETNESSTTKCNPRTNEPLTTAETNESNLESSGGGGIRKRQRNFWTMHVDGLEDSLFIPDNEGQTVDPSSFRYMSRKKFSHDANLSVDHARRTDDKEVSAAARIDCNERLLSNSPIFGEGNHQKALVWRSPLIATSPETNINRVRQQHKRNPIESTSSFPQMQLKVISVQENRTNSTSESTGNDSSGVSEISGVSRMQRSTLKKNTCRPGTHFPITDRAVSQSQSQATTENVDGSESRVNAVERNMLEVDELVSTPLLIQLGLIQAKEPQRPSGGVTETVGISSYYLQLTGDAELTESRQKQFGNVVRSTQTAEPETSEEACDSRVQSTNVDSTGFQSKTTQTIEITEDNDQAPPPPFFNFSFKAFPQTSQNEAGSIGDDQQLNLSIDSNITSQYPPLIFQPNDTSVFDSNINVTSHVPRETSQPLNFRLDSNSQESLFGISPQPNFNNFSQMPIERKPRGCYGPDFIPFSGSNLCNPDFQNCRCTRNEPNDSRDDNNCYVHYNRPTLLCNYNLKRTRFDSSASVYGGCANAYQSQPVISNSTGNFHDPNRGGPCCSNFEHDEQDLSRRHSFQSSPYKKWNRPPFVSSSSMARVFEPHDRGQRHCEERSSHFNCCPPSTSGNFMMRQCLFNFEQSRMPGFAQNVPSGFVRDSRYNSDDSNED